MSGDNFDDQSIHLDGSTATQLSDITFFGNPPILSGVHP